MPAPSAKSTLEQSFRKYPPAIAATGRAAVTKMQRILPGWTAMVYDNYNALVVGFSPTDRPSDAIYSLALYPRWVNLFFLQGAFLKDPHRILKGGGKWVRSVRLESAADLDRPEIRALIAEARADAPPLKRPRRAALVIRSISAKQRPRRPRET